MESLPIRPTGTFGAEPHIYQLPDQFKVTEQGVVSRSQVEKDQFTKTCVDPFLAKLNTIKEQVQERANKGYALADRLPSQKEILELQDENYKLSEAWYGKGNGNYSLMYQFLIDIHELAGSVAYTTKDFPTERTADGTVITVSDEECKARSQGLQGKRKMDAKTGARTGQEGKTTIDNSVLRNIFTMEEHLERNYTKSLQKLTVAVYRRQQLQMLKDLGLSEKSPAVIKKELALLSDEDLKEKGISATRNSFILLKNTGRMIENWGELPQEVKEENFKIAKQMAVQGHRELKEARIANKREQMTREDKQVTLEEATKQVEDEDQFWSRFVKFVNENPGRYFEPDDKMINQFLREVIGGIYANRKDTDLLTPELRAEYKKVNHHLLVITGMINDKIAVVPRTTTEEETPHRFLAVPWERKTELKNLNAEGGERVLRPRGQKEVTGMRANEMPYQPSHGMGIPVTSFHAELPGVNLLGYNVNLPLDEKACLENWYLIDIEKIVAEYKLLNPALPKDQRMKGEIAFDVGQNPKAGSSVQYTQHTQMSSNTIADYPIYQEKNNPRYSKALDAEVDIVQVGKEPDAFFIKIVTDDPTKPEIIDFLKSLQMNYLKTFGGAANVDFNVKCINNENGTCTLIFTPLSQIVKEAKGTSPIDVTRNPKTGKGNLESHVPAHCIDTGKGGGLFKMPTHKDPNNEVLVDVLSWAQEGRPMMGRLYDYTRLPGARAIADDAVSNIVQ